MYRIVLDAAVAEQMATLPDEALVGYAEVLLLVGSRLAGF